MQEINVEDEYRYKDEIDRILTRSGVMLGSLSDYNVQKTVYSPESFMFVQKTVPHCSGGLLKLIDELVSNSVDCHRKKESLFPCTKVKVTVSKNGIVTVEDDGGIPVKMHKEMKMYVPQMIFGTLGTSSNYDDTKERNGVGQNGLGAKLTNIFSHKFTVETCDTKKHFMCEWSGNMRNKSDNVIKPSKNHCTKVSAYIELHRLGMDCITEEMVRVIEKRCIDAAGINAGLSVEFICSDYGINSQWNFPDYNNYLKLYTDKAIYTCSGTNYTLSVTSGGHKNIGFVNGAYCDEGTHMNKCDKIVTDLILEECKKRGMDMIDEKIVQSHYNFFLNITIANPTYGSQAKEKLANRMPNDMLPLKRTFAKDAEMCGVYDSIQEEYDIYKKAKEAKKVSEHNSRLKIVKTDKLIAPTNTKGGEFWLFEGTSASNGFRAHRTMNQTAYMLRGKMLNVVNADIDTVMRNTEYREIIAALGLLFNSPKSNLRTIKYDKIILATDMDTDGNHICALGLLFFETFFPELLEAGMVYRALSPIIIAANKKERLHFHTQSEFRAAEKSLQGYEITYCKGLGGLEDADYKSMMQEQKLIQFRRDENTAELMQIWFNGGDDTSKMQKQKIILQYAG